MSLYILDTDHISLVQRGNQNIALRSAGIPPEFIAITVISVEEQLRGRLSLAKFSILDFTAESKDRYLELKQDIKIGKQDLKIAAISLSVNGIMVTRNHRDFSKVPNLRIEDWTI